MPLLADPVVDWAALSDVVLASLVGGIGVTAAFAIGLYGAVRAVDARREGQLPLAYGYWTLMTVALVIVLASVVFAIVVITNKT